MRGEFNGMKALIMNGNKSAYHVHCFVHPLQLVIVAMAKKHHGAINFFALLSVLMNVVCASCKRKVMLIESQKKWEKPSIVVKSKPKVG